MSSTAPASAPAPQQQQPQPATARTAGKNRGRGGRGGRGGAAAAAQTTQTPAAAPAAATAAPAAASASSTPAPAPAASATPAVAVAAVAHIPLSNGSARRSNGPKAARPAAAASAPAASAASAAASAPPAPVIRTTPIVKTKPVFVSVESLEPEGKGVNLIAQVIELRVIFDRTNPKSGVKNLLMEALIADSTGSIWLTLKNEQSAGLGVSQWLYVRNGHITMYKGRMRVSFDRWGLVEPVPESEQPTGAAAIVKRDNNVSDQEWELKPVAPAQQEQ